MRNRRLLRIIGTSTAVVLLMLAAALFIVWKELPDLRRMFVRIGWVETPIAVPMSALVASSAQKSTPLPTPAMRAPAAANTPTAVASPPAADILGYLVTRFVERGNTDISVCNNLAEVAMRIPPGASGYRDALANLALGNFPDNPLIESTLAPVGLFVRQPSISRIISRVQSVERGADPVLVRDSTFSSWISSASAEVLANRGAFESAAQHAYHLYAIARAAQINPRLANDDRTLSLCARIEPLAEQSPTQPTGTVDSLISAQQMLEMDREKSEVLRFLAEVGLAPEQVGYDPNLRNQVRTEIRSDRLTLTVPWMSQVFGARFEILVPGSR